MPPHPSLLSILTLLSAAHATLRDPYSCTASTTPLGRPASLATCPEAVDEDAAFDAGTWAPWTARPYCVEPAAAAAPGPLFCVYTYAPFRGGGGRALSVVTTPALAAGAVDALDDAVVPPVFRSRLTGDEEPAYAVEDVAGRGKGLVARRRIRRWEVLLVDYPALLAHVDVFSAVDDESREDLLEQAVQQLSEPQQDEVLALARSKGGEPIEDILRTNIFGVELGLEIPHLGLYPVASRLNHHCKPNIFWRYSAHTLAVEVIAMRDIEEGEEIAQSYVPLGLPYEDRKKSLENWGFACNCPLCSSSKSKRAASDERRERLLDIYHDLNDGASGKANLTDAAIGDIVDEMESLINEENLEVRRLVYYGVVARAYMSVGDLVAAKKYVELCEDLWVRFAGDDQDYLAGMQQLRHELSEREKKATIDSD
ncbi:SET domain-containing protein [Hypoxylon sp. FL1284]|nr:SET domain-containing protein [Hypoxylon sp. FL1284]